MNASMLAVSSSRGTVHVFHLADYARMDKCITMSRDDDEEVEVVATLDMMENKKRWYDGLLSNIKQTSSNSNGGGGKADEETRQIIRSIAKIKCEKPVIPNIIAMLPTSTSATYNQDDEKREELVAICFENGKFLVYAMATKMSTSRSSNNNEGKRMKMWPRPILADDIMFESESALVR
jgi:hypothetical protein